MRTEVYLSSHLRVLEGSMRLIPRAFSLAEPRAPSPGTAASGTAMTGSQLVHGGIVGIPRGVQEAYREVCTLPHHGREGI